MKESLLILAVFALLRYACGQNAAASDLPCGEENLSCSTVDGNGDPICLNRSQLCDGTLFCPSGGDEGGMTINSLDCKFVFFNRKLRMLLDDATVLYHYALCYI